MIKKATRLIFYSFFKKSFRFWQKIGLNILPNHFYSPIPDLNELNINIWQNHSKMVGININQKNQLELLNLFLNNFKKEFDQIPFTRDQDQQPYQYYLNNDFFGPISGEVLYCMIRQFKPKRIIEIGSGFSTFLIAQTIIKNFKMNPEYKCELISIDPFPNKILKRGLPGLAKLITKKVQEIPVNFFTKLEENDILFIDSSHALKIGGDVQYEYLEIIPRLSKGVIIHIHDILLPAEYHKKWILKDKLFWNEQYLLQAFLTFNDYFEILFAGSFLHHHHSKYLKSIFKSYQKTNRFSTSFWMRKVK